MGKLSPKDYIQEFGITLGEEIIKPTKIYSKTVEALADFNIHGMAHITGGGLIENLPRILPEGLKIRINKGSWNIPPVLT